MSEPEPFDTDSRFGRQYVDWERSDARTQLSPILSHDSSSQQRFRWSARVTGPGIRLYGLGQYFENERGNVKQQLAGNFRT